MSQPLEYTQLKFSTHWSLLFGQQNDAAMRTSCMKHGDKMEALVWTLNRADGRMVAWMQLKEPMEKAMAGKLLEIDPLWFGSTNPIEEFQSWMAHHPAKTMTTPLPPNGRIEHRGEFKLEEAQPTGLMPGRDHIDYIVQELNALWPDLTTDEAPGELVRADAKIWSRAWHGL